MMHNTFDVLFSPETGMAELVRKPCLWRSAVYFTMSVGFFSGVATNVILAGESLQLRFALIAAVVIICAAALALYGFLLHGIMETFGALAGDSLRLICLLGYTALPFLVLTPCALLASKSGFAGLLLYFLFLLAGFFWMLYLLMRSLEAVYLVDFTRAAVVTVFSILLIYTVFILPWNIFYRLLVLKLFQ